MGRHRVTSHDQPARRRCPPAVRRRTRRRAAAALAVAAAISTAVPAAAGDLDPLTLLPVDATRIAEATVPGRGTTDVRPQATIEDEEAWCSYLSWYYLSFPSPWSARVINCRHTDMFVAPLFSDGSRGMCVLVPARHSRHLGGDIVRRVVDVRVC